MVEPAAESGQKKHQILLRIWRTHLHVKKGVETIRTNIPIVEEGKSFWDPLFFNPLTFFQSF